MVSGLEDLKREIREFKPPFMEGVIEEQGSKITVDWKKIAEMEKTAREGTHSATLLYGTYTHLIELGILSLESKGNYQLTGSSIVLNPRSHGLIQVYFTREEDAEAYKEAMFGGVQYDVNISKLSD
jgi:hypothetical protein